MMSLSRKRPTFLRFVLCLFIGLLLSAGILMAVQQFYQQYLEKSALREPFFLLACISALIIALLLVFPASKPMRLFKWLWRLMIMAVLVALVWGVGTLYIAQNDILYMPGRREVNAEAALQENPSVEEVTITGPENAVYHGYFWKAAPDKAGLVLYFGGNGELAAGRVYSMLRDDTASVTAGYHFMMVDYPGYGKSTGEPTEETVFGMAGAALDYALAREDVDAQRLVIAGWSLGTGPAGKLAAQSNPAGLILMAPYYSGTELVNSYLQSQFNPGSGIFSRIPSFLVRNKFPTESFARITQSKALIIGGRTDTIIPIDQAQRLAGLYTNGQFLLLEGGHGAVWTDTKSLEAITAFLQEVSTTAQLVTVVP
jgi:pimeloyl-ACP methyl ester carboxylesterase